MPLMTINYYCNYIQMTAQLHVILPSDMVEGKRGQAPTLFLLAPEGEDGSRWIRHTQAERLADMYHVAMVLVSSLEGCYTDMAYGYQFFQSLEKGIPEFLEQNIPAVSLENGRCYAAGCSMGGMGAVKLALCRPERFAAAGSFSGRLDNKASFEKPIVGDWLTHKRMVNLWGSPEGIAGTCNDLTSLSDRAAQAEKPLPSLYISAGIEDVGYASSKAFAGKQHISTCFVEREGRQDWRNWSGELEHFLRWALLKEDTENAIG